MLVLKIAAGIILAGVILGIAQLVFLGAILSGVGRSTAAQPPLATDYFPTPIRVTAAPTRTSTPSPSRTADPTPSPSAVPTSTASASPSPSASPVAITFTLVKSPVARGNTGQVSVGTAPNLSCSITVSYASGPSTAQGLTPKTTDGAGATSWTWTVAPTTTPGTWPIDVRCGSAIGHASFVVQ